MGNSLNGQLGNSANVDTVRAWCSVTTSSGSGRSITWRRWVATSSSRSASPAPQLEHGVARE